MTRSSAEVPEEVGDYHDEDGFVYRNVPHSEALPNWTLMSESQQAHVQPLTKFDVRRFEANEARKAELLPTLECHGPGITLHGQPVSFDDMARKVAPDDVTCTFEVAYVIRAIRCPKCDVTSVVEGRPEDVPKPGDACDCGGILEAAPPTTRCGTATITGIDRKAGPDGAA